MTLRALQLAPRWTRRWKGLLDGDGRKCCPVLLA